MCGRWSLIADEKTLSKRFGATVNDIIKPRYNIAPMQEAPIIQNDNPKEFSVARWGLIPFFAKDESIGYKTINARIEGIEEKPAYREPLKKHRCLIPADGFYEWKTIPQGKLPYRFTMKDKGLFAFAGLFDVWKKEGKELTTFTIITVPPNDIVGKVHNRMPAILQKENEQEWLSDKSFGQLHKFLDLLKPYPSEQMNSIQISNAINNVKNDGPYLIKPIDAKPGLKKFF